MKLTDILQSSSRRAPDKEAIIFQDQRITYAQLDHRTRQAASVLADQGVKKGDRVGLITYNVPGFLYAAFGAWYLGAIVIPINHKLTANEIEYTANHSGIKFGVASPELVNEARKGAPGATWMITDPDSPADFDQTLSEAVPAEEAEFDDDHPAMILYTSGTTSEPKGCVLTHGSTYEVQLTHTAHMKYDSTDSHLLAMPIWHSAPLNLAALTMLFVAGQLVMMKEYDPAQVLPLLETEKITTMFGPAIAYLAPLKWAAAVGKKPTDFDLSNVRRFLYGGAPTDSTTLRRLIDAYGFNHFECVFGMTEMGPSGMSLPPEVQLEKAGSVGKEAQVGMDLRVVTANGEDAVAGEVGEVWFKGPGRMKEYWDNPEATAQAFVGDWYRTGDLARMDEDGYLFIVDRLKDVVIVGGENVYTLEVEEAAAAHPGVAEIAVVGRPDPEWGEQLVAFVTPNEQQPVSESELREFLEERLARYKIPREFVFRETLPRNPSGKLLKHKLRAEAQQDVVKPA